MSFNVFEAAVTSEHEVGLARQASQDKFDAAIYDVREKLGPSLFASRDIEEFRDRVAMMKNDQSLFRVIGAHLNPVTGVVRRIVGRNGVLEKEFRTYLAGQHSAPHDFTDEDYSRERAKERVRGDFQEDDPAKRPASFYDQHVPQTPGPRHEAERAAALRATGLFNKGACWPGCHENEAHAKKFHQKKEEKESARRRADFSGEVSTTSTFKPSDDELVPEDNWDGYRDKVDQNSSKVERNFTSATLYRDWCEANGLSPIRLSSLDAYATNLSDADYFHLARQIQAWEFEHKPSTPKGQGKSKLKDVTAGQHDVDPKQPWKNTMADDPYFDLQETPDFADIPLGGEEYGGKHRAEDFRGPVSPGEDAGIARNPYTGDTETGRFEGNPEGHGHWTPNDRTHFEAFNRHAFGTTERVDYGGHSFLTAPQEALRAAEKKKQQLEDAGYVQVGEDLRGFTYRKPTTASRDPMQSYIRWCQANRLKRISARNVAYFAGNDTALCYHLALRMKRAIHTARLRYAEEYSGSGDVQDKSGPFAGPHGSFPVGTEKDLNDAKSVCNMPSTRAKHPGVCDKVENMQKPAARRTAAPDYLQKADDALTQLLNQKAQEFQETIAPLQQALVTVQQAEQLQQQANPLNVLPTPGTVNVMPGGNAPGGGPSTADAVGMPDPNAPDLSGAANALAGPIGGAPPGDAGLGAAPGGGTPDDGAGPPPAAAGGGLPPDLMQQMQQQASRRKRGGQGKGRGATRPRQAAGPRSAANSVFDLWQQWLKDPSSTQRGGPADYDAFAQQYGISPRSLTLLKNRHGVPGANAYQGSVKRYLSWCARHGLRSDRTANLTWYAEHLRPPERQRLARALWAEAKPPNIAEEAAQNQWRQMDSSMTAYGYTFDKASGHWTKPGQKPVKNHWPIESGRHDRPYRNPNLPGEHELGEPDWAPLQQKVRGDFRQEMADLSDAELEPENPAFRQHGGRHSKPPTHTVPMDDVEYESYEPEEKYSGGWHETYAGEPLDKLNPEGQVLGRRQRQAEWNGSFSDAAPGWFNPPGWEDQGPAEPGAARLEWQKHNQQDYYDENGHVRKHKHKGGARKTAWSGWGPAVHPKTRQVTGWDWNPRLEGYLANRPQRFACECGDSFDTPTGFHRCACGKQWNSYVVGTGGSNHEASAEKFLVREIPVRHDVIVANRKLEAGAFGPPLDPHDPFGYKDLPKYKNDQEFYDAMDAKGLPLPEPWNTRRKQQGSYADDLYQRGLEDPNTRERFETGHHPRRVTSPDVAVDSMDEHNQHAIENGANPYQPPRSFDGSIYKLTEPGELEGDGEDDGRPRLKSTPKDWHRRDPNQRWVKSAGGEFGSLTDDLSAWADEMERNKADVKNEALQFKHPRYPEFQNWLTTLTQQQLYHGKGPGAMNFRQFLENSPPPGDRQQSTGRLDAWMQEKFPHGVPAYDPYDRVTDPNEYPHGG